MRKDKVIVYWVSYLEGQQRVLLFTQDERVAYQTRGKIDAERSNTEIILSLRGIGLSFINGNINERLHELAYITINDSAALWEVNVAHRWKMLTLELASWIEDRWKQDCKRAQMKDYVHVDFEKMHMTKPFYGELRRRYYSAFWLQYRRSKQHSYIHCRLHRLQIDNQQVDCIFPTVLCPTAVPPHIVRKFGVKPCLEFAVMKRHRPTHNQDVYKFVKVLLQEFSIQLDRSFILSAYDMLKPWFKEEKPSVRIRTDIALLHQPISSKCSGSYNERKVIIEYMHLSPIKLQLSFSPRGTTTHLHSSSLVGRSCAADLLYLLLDSLAPKLNDIKAVKLRMAYYEIQGHVVIPHNLVTDIFCHYSSQLAQQLHVLILGLDVLGNPYARVSDFTEGCGELFYEPSLGMLESPEEFSQSLSQSAQMMMGHCISGAANTSNLITSVVSSQIHASFNEDYKKKHRFCLQSSCDLPESLVASMKTFEMGVALGLSGVIMKPLVGQHEGVEGFFRGVGKGLMGLLTKTSGGILDCTSMATDGITRSIEMGEDIILRARLPRYLNPYMGTKPFSLYEAIGMQLLYTLSKGHYADTDVYWAHATLNTECKSTLLVTLQHIFLVEKCRVWGMWDVEWVVRVDDIMAVPEVMQDKLVFKVRQDESFNFFSGDERYIQCKDENILQWLRNKIEMVLILNMEDKPCPSADT